MAAAAVAAVAATALVVVVLPLVAKKSLRMFPISIKCACARAACVRASPQYNYV